MVPCGAPARQSGRRLQLLRPACQRHWLSDQVHLQHVTTGRTQKVGLGRGFHVFSHHPQAQVFDHRENRWNGGGVVLRTACGVPRTKLRLIFN